MDDRTIEIAQALIGDDRNRKYLALHDAEFRATIEHLARGLALAVDLAADGARSRMADQRRRQEQLERGPSTTIVTHGRTPAR